jgi:hypothetical protein
LENEMSSTFRCGFFTFCTTLARGSGHQSFNSRINFNYSSPFGFYFGTFSEPYNTLSNGVSAVASGGTIAIKPGSSAETMTISKPMTITAVGGAATVGH